MLMAKPSLEAPGLPSFVRSRGGIRLTVAATPRGSAPMTVAESGGYRLRFPRSHRCCEGVLINTGGGMTGGDRMSVDVTVGAGAEAVLTTQAAEKIYRSDGEETEVEVSLTLEEGARLAWLPQEQILFDRGRFRRRLDVRAAEDASLTMVESTVFGRLAMGERVRTGAFHDRWRIRRGGRLVLAEDVRLEGSIDALLARRALAGGACALGTVLLLSPDAEGRRDEARAMLEDASSECGLSAWDGMILARFLSRDPQALRSDLARFIARWRGAPMPRSWQT